MGIRIHPGTTPQARAELTAFTHAYPINPAAPNNVYYCPDPTDAAQYLDMEHNTAELIPAADLIRIVTAAA